MTSSQSPVPFAVVMLLLVSCTPWAESQSTPVAPVELVKAVIHSELNPPQGADIHWKYLLDKQVDGKQETREVIETKFGSLDRLISIAGKGLTEAQQREETERVWRLSHHPAEQQKLEQSRRKDAEQCNRLLMMIPDAFVFEYGGENGALTKVNFKPNPRFQPPSREGMVLHEMAGEIWVDAKQLRLVSIVGQLMSDVKFAGGLLGHLEKGGQFTVKRSEIVPGHWELTEMSVSMRGKALLFKTISVQQKEFHTNFQAVPDDLSLPNAAGILLGQALVAAKR